MIWDLLEEEYHMAKTLRRPSNAMMLAVNAAIGGNKKKVNELVKEDGLSRRELDARLEIRDGEKYDVKKKGGRPKGSTNKKAGRALGRARATVSASNAENVLQMMDGRTKTVTLLRIAYRANELLDGKPKAEVQKFEKAMDDAEKLKQQYEKTLALIGDEIPI